MKEAAKRISNDSSQIACKLLIVVRDFLEKAHN
jgi:hypothetical protein